MYTHKLITFHQRIVPSGAQDIGTWEIIFNTIAGACVLTNAGLVAFTMNILTRSKTATNAISYVGGVKNNANFSSLACVWMFVGFVFFMAVLQYLVDVHIGGLGVEI